MLKRALRNIRQSLAKKPSDPYKQFFNATHIGTGDNFSSYKLHKRLVNFKARQASIAANLTRDDLKKIGTILGQKMKSASTGAGRLSSRQVKQAAREARKEGLNREAIKDFRKIAKALASKPAKLPKSEIQREGLDIQEISEKPRASDLIPRVELKSDQAIPPARAAQLNLKDVSPKLPSEEAGGEAFKGEAERIIEPVKKEVVKDKSKEVEVEEPEETQGEEQVAKEAKKIVKEAPEVEKEEEPQDMPID